MATVATSIKTEILNLLNLFIYFLFSCFILASLTWRKRAGS